MYTRKNCIIFIFITAKLLATGFALYIVDQFTPLIDAKLYQDEKYFITSDGDVIPTDKIAFRTYALQYFVVATNYLTSPIISHYIFSIISISGILWFIKFYKVTWHILFIILLPTSMIWTSIISKEAIYYLFFSILLICWNFYLNNSWKKYYWYILTPAFLFCLVLRPHYTFPVFWLFWVVFIIKNFKNFKPVLFGTLFSALIICLFVIFFGGYIDNYLSINLFDFKWRAFTAFDFNARASRHFDLGFGNLQNDLDIIYDRIGQVVFVSDEAYEIISQKMNSVFVTGFFYGIIGPFVEETIKRPVFLPFLIEGIIILLIPFMFLIYLKYKKINNKNIFYLNYIYGILPAIILLMIIHSFFGIFNPGTAIRWRINFELIFYFAPYLIYLNLKELHNERNSPFSS